MVEVDTSKAEAGYWQNQIAEAEREMRYKRWIDVGQQYFDRYRLESQGLAMSGIDNTRGRMIYNLLWSNVQTMLPMLWSRMPDPNVSRRFSNMDPVARMASTITERAVSVDLELDDMDEQAKSCGLDYSIVGRGVLRSVYESVTVNSRIPLAKEAREDGSPRFLTEAGDEIPQSMVQREAGRLFTIDPKTTNERAPIEYWNWKDFLIGPGRKWKEIQQQGWIAYRSYMTKARATKRFGKDVANQLNYSYSPYNQDDSREATRKEVTSSLEKLAVVWEVWSAKDRNIYWVSPGVPQLLDKQADFLELIGFFNTPRPLRTTFTNDTLIPVPDYAEYRTQAAEMDQITAKIEQIVEDIRAGGLYNAAIASLGNALRNKRGGYHPVDEWASFAQGGGMDGAVQEFQLEQKVNAVRGLYEHRQAVKRDADEISGMIDLFRGQQTQTDETLGQSEMRSALGGLRINDRQREFQRYIRDCLQMKAEIIVSKFDDERILEMADLPALMNESPEVSRITLYLKSPEGQQAVNDPNQAMQIAAMASQAQSKQAALIRQALGLLKDDRMRTFRLDIETDATVALDENVEKAQAGEFVKVVGDYFANVLNSPVMAQSPDMKGLAAEMLMFLVRRFRIGRSLEQKIEQVVENMAKAPPPQPQPDPLTLDVQRRAKADEQDFALGQQKNQIDQFEAQTDRMKAETDAAMAQVKAVEAAQKAGREDLRLAKDILEGDEVGGNA